MTQDEINKAEWGNPDNWSEPNIMAMYFSKKDSRIFIPKKISWMGCTINFGHNSAAYWLLIIYGLFFLLGALIGGSTTYPLMESFYH